MREFLLDLIDWWNHKFGKYKPRTFAEIIPGLVLGKKYCKIDEYGYYISLISGQKYKDYRLLDRTLVTTRFTEKGIYTFFTEDDLTRACWIELEEK